MTKKGRTPEEWAVREKMLKEHLAGLVATLDQGLEITRIRQEGPTPEPVEEVEVPEVVEEVVEESVKWEPLEEEDEEKDEELSIIEQLKQRLKALEDRE